MVEMIAKMSGAMLLQVLITWGVWSRWQKSKKDLKTKILVGIIYGLCAVASTHFGVDYKQMVINVRDLGPLVAGLFFSPVSGILAGLIGGVERYIAGTYWGIGTYTRVACSVSTCMAGFLAAILNRLLFRGKIPPVAQSLFIGSVTEVFHMYAVLISHRGTMRKAYAIVKSCSVPMILFNGLGMALGAMLILYLSGQLNLNWRSAWSSREETPIARRFQRWLFLVTVCVFAIDFSVSFHFQTRMAYQDGASTLNSTISGYRKYYLGIEKDPDAMKRLEDYARLNTNSVCMIFDGSGNVVVDPLPNEMGKLQLVERDLDEFRAKLNRGSYTSFPEYFDGKEMLVQIRSLDEQYYIMVGLYASKIYENREEQMYEISLSDILLFSVLYLLISLLVERLVVGDLQSVNNSLEKIIDGDLDEKVSAKGSSEFAGLSEDINLTVNTLKGYIDEAEKRIERELKLASLIQESAVPSSFEFPRKDFEIFALMDPARQVGGDFYDFFFIDSDQLVLVIADVSDKGIPAALFMMRAKTAIASMARSGSSPAELMSSVNNTLCEGNEAGMFVTAWIGIVDLKTGLMRCSNAGHEYPALMHSGGDYELLKDRHSLPLAAMEDCEMEEYDLQLTPGDRLFIYTDGVPEAINSKEEQYGTDRLITKLNALKNVCQEEVLSEVYEDIQSFVGGENQYDDLTMLGFTYVGR